MLPLFGMIREKGANMISKELLSEVLGHDDICNERIIQNKLLYMCKNDGMIDYEYEYNIYELAHKCKEWASTKGYILFSKTRLSSSLASCYFDVMGFHDYEDDFKNDFRAESEQQAVFDACQWILDNKEDI